MALPLTGMSGDPPVRGARERPARHLRHCVATAIRTSDQARLEAVDEVTSTMRQVVRL